MVKFIRTKPFHTLVLLSALVIAAVYFIEYVLDYPPCILCLYQRLPWYGLLIIGLLGWQWQNRTRILHRNFLYLGLLVLLCSIALAGYHVGVEFLWWPGPESCGNAAQNLSAEALLATPAISCEEVAFRLLGGSLALWNFIVSILLLGGGILWLAHNV